MKKLKANVCAVTHAGRVRDKNEDNYNLNGKTTSSGELRKGSAYVQNLTEPFFMAACDGMGGESYGEIASGMACDILTRHANNIYDSGDEFSAALTVCLNDCNARLCEEMKARGKRLGTTMAAMFCVQGRCICTNIGDTRIYRYSKGILEQMSIDHTHAQTIVDSGEVPMDKIKNIPDAHRLTRHLGVFKDEAQLTPNIFVMDDAEDGDIVLICSDGLTDMVSDEDITHILSTCESSQDAASSLVRLALQNGGKDNITVLVALLGVEQTEIFAPIAQAMVGDAEPDYEDEYMVSYGGNAAPPAQPVSPYANADSAYSPAPDKKKLIIIGAAVIGAIALALLLAFGIKALINKGNEKGTVTDDTASSATTSAYAVQTLDPGLLTTVTTSTTETTTEADTTTTKRKPTTSKPTTTKPTTKPTTSAQPTATTESTTESTTKEPESSSTTTTTKATTTTTTTKASTTSTTKEVEEPGRNP